MKKTKAILCFLLAMVMVLSFTACKKNPAEEDSGSVEIEYEYEYIYEDGDKDASNAGDSTDKDGDKDATQSGTTSNGKPNSSKKPTSASNSLKERAKKFKGTTVRYATWKDPDANEDGIVVKAFQKEYDINVKIDAVGQAGYANTIAGYIASGNSPDIYFSNNDFPVCMSCLQPIDAAKLDMSDPIWEKGMFDASTINGKTYLINTVGNIWNEVDCVFFNKRLMKENNITTPEEYYKAGKWNFDAMTKVMRDVKALGDDYTGGYIDWETALGLTGSSYYKWSNGKFSNGINQTLIDVSRYLSTVYKEGLINGLADYNYRDEFLNGKVGIALTNAYGLKKTGYWSKMNADDIGFTYLPDFNSSVKAGTCGLFRGWGIIKGAKNPEAAGIFLRYYLDVNNYDTSSAFINSEAESFFFKLTSGVSSAKKNIVISDNLGAGKWELGQIAKNSPDQVAGIINAQKNAIDSGVKNMNDFLAKQTK